MSLIGIAYDRGKSAKETDKMRVCPFYNVRIFQDGKRIDITPMIETAWLAGYDGEQHPDAVDSQAS